MSKSEEELVDEVKQWAGNLDAQNMETPQGRWFDKHVEAEETICPYCGINADKVIEHVKETYDQAHTAGKKARDEEILDMVEGKIRTHEHSAGCGEVCSALTDIKNRLTTDTQDDVCSCAYDSDDMQEKQENCNISDCCGAEINWRWKSEPNQNAWPFCKSCGAPCEAVEEHYCGGPDCPCQVPNSFDTKPDPIEPINLHDKTDVVGELITKMLNWHESDATKSYRKTEEVAKEIIETVRTKNPHLDKKINQIINWINNQS